MRRPSIAGVIYLRPDSVAAGAAWRTVAGQQWRVYPERFPRRVSVSVISPSPSYVMSSYYKSIRSVDQA